MAKDEQILIRLESDQKQKWIDHAEEHDQYRDTTNLIEQAVEDRISTDTAEFSPEEAMLQMSREIQNLQSGIENLQEISERIEDTQATSIGLEETADDIISYFKSRE